jgi:hypothetical protein
VCEFLAALQYPFSGFVCCHRMDCSKAAIHAPVVAGISGDQKKGAWSVALSGGYEDDVDAGYAL